MKILRRKRLWLDLEIDWSRWLVGVAADRDYNVYNDRTYTDIGFFFGPFGISINF